MREPEPVLPIIMEIETPVGPDRAWQAVTDPTQVTEWFAGVTPAGGVGSPYGIDFGDGSTIEGVVRAHEPGRRLAYSWTWAGDEGGPTTLVTWEVEPAGGGARIQIGRAHV